jgi:hypothetical protein
MDRREQILKHVAKDQRGIEIGPWFALALQPGRPFCLPYDVFVTKMRDWLIFRLQPGCGAPHPLKARRQLL